jgi:hypothetical protein
MEFALAVWGAPHYWVGWQEPVRAGRDESWNDRDDLELCPELSGFVRVAKDVVGRWNTLEQFGTLEMDVNPARETEFP